MKPNSNVLEIGCGIGTVSHLILKYITEGSFVGLDISSESIEMAKKRNAFHKKAEFLVNDMSNFTHKTKFDFVVFPDVLEHIPSWDREKFVSELKRVAKKRVILSFPLGTKAHIRAEKELKDFLKKKGEEVGYLEEHIANGLPTLKELEKILKNHPFQIFFGENFRLNNFLFKVQFALGEKRCLGMFYFYFQKLINFLLNVFYYPFSLSEKPRRFTNRAYVVINK